MRKYLFTALVVLIPSAAFATQIGVPTLGEWGMIGAAVVLGAAGLYKTIKK